MSEPVSRALLWLFVVNLGVALGAGLYESRIVVPRWVGAAGGSARHWDPEAARRDDTGRRFWAFVTTGPLTLLTVANLVAAWGAPGAARGWWLTAAAAAVAERAMTLGYFIPTTVGLMRAPNSPRSVASVTRWARLNHVRLALALAAWLAALNAFALAYRHGR